MGGDTLSGPFILLTYSTPVISMYFQTEWRTVDPDEIAASEAG